MLASGAEDFKDVIGPILSADDEQAALGICRTWSESHLSSLGPNWRGTVSSWKEQARIAFVSEILHHRNVPEIVMFARSDPSPRVWHAAIEGLAWTGSVDELVEFLNSLDAKTLDDLLQKLDADLIPHALHDRAVAALQNSFDVIDHPMERLRILVKEYELGRTNIVGYLKEDLSKISGRIEDHRTHFVIKPALNIVRRIDEEWTSAWVAERVADGSLWHESWSKLIRAVPGALSEALLGRLECEDFKHNYFGNVVDVLVAGAAVSTAERAFLKLCELRAKIKSSPDERHELEWSVERQLQTLLRAFPASIAVAALSSCFSRLANGIELDVITRLFSSAGRSRADLWAEVDRDLRERFRAYLKSSVAVVLEQEDHSGELKANLASVLASVGAPEDIAEMRVLINADIERVRKGRAARARGDRTSLGNGGMMSYATWHIRAVVRLDPQNCDAVLVDLLNVPEYEREVSTELVRLLEPPKAEQGFVHKVDYERVWAARSRKITQPYQERRQGYANALRDRINAVLRERVAVQQKRPYEFRLRTLASALAAVDSHGSSELVFEVMSLPDEWNDEPRVSSFETLLFNGVVLPADLTLTLIDSSLDRFRKYGVQQQDEWLVERFLCLLPFVEDPARGIAKIRELISELRLYGHHLRDVVEAVGHCRCDDAVAFLREIGSDKNRAAQLEDVWINALAAIDTPESRNLLISFVDPELAGPPNEMEFRRDDVLAARIAELGRADAGINRRLLNLCEADLPPAKRLLLAKVIGQRADLEAVMAGLNLTDDAVNPSIPYEIWSQMENAFVERRPHGQAENTFTLEPRSSNAVRARLLDMANNDERRKKSAFDLLAQIEEWRLEYGRPTGEPRHPAFDSGEPWPPMPKAG